MIKITVKRIVVQKEKINIIIIIIIIMKRFYRIFLDF